ncbi:hypothetical protein Sjap_018455 [Stephania japonica]|uniref:Uncharacterized protein n=1 Tax=Stephania japonica TaxID=461633 RepID=A0AAP0NLJ6_9MAGN
MDGAGKYNRGATTVKTRARLRQLRRRQGRAPLGGHLHRSQSRTRRGGEKGWFPPPLRLILSTTAVGQRGSGPLASRRRSPLVRGNTERWSGSSLQPPIGGTSFPLPDSLRELLENLIRLLIGNIVIVAIIRIGSRYGNHHGSSYASPQPDFYMSRPSPRIPQQERRTIEDIEKDMISDWLSPSTNKCPFDDWSNSSHQPDIFSSMQNQPSKDIIRYCLATVQDMNLTEQELDQWTEERDREVEEEIKSILQKISTKTMSAIPLESVEVNEVTPIEDYWSEPEETIEVSLYEPDIIMA